MTKVEFNGVDLSKSVTSISGVYVHKFDLPKMRWDIRLRSWLTRPYRMHKAGFGWVFTKRQFNKKMLELLNAKVEKEQNGK